MNANIGRASRLAVLLATCGLSACSTFDQGSSSSGGSTLTNLFRYGSTTEPPLAKEQVVAAADCPYVSVADGRSNIRNGGNQVSISNVARECIERRDGSVAVKVGVEGRALLGPGGRAGRFDVPIAFALKRGDRVIVSRVKRIGVVIPAGEAQGGFTAVEGELIVPRGTGDFDIVVGLGGAG